MTRCRVCGVLLDDYHESAHLWAMYGRWKLERIIGGGNDVIDAILKLGRGLVRPVALLAITGAIIAAVFVRLLPAEALLAIGGPVLGWWFKERAERNET